MTLHPTNSGSETSVWSEHLRVATKHYTVTHGTAATAAAAAAAAANNVDAEEAQVPL
jgi:hypothetical protein